MSSDLVKQKQDKILHLLDTKSRLIADRLLLEQFKQLSHLTKSEQDRYINTAKIFMMDKIIIYLTQLK